MGATVEWYDDTQTLIIIRYVDHWSWDDFYTVAATTYKMIESVPHTVDLIIDMLQSAGYPPGSMMTHIRNNTRKLKDIDNFGNTAMVTPNAFLKMFSHAYQRLFKPVRPSGQMFFVNSIEAALSALMKAKGDEIPANA